MNYLDNSRAIKEEMGYMYYVSRKKVMSFARELRVYAYILIAMNYITIFMTGAMLGGLAAQGSDKTSKSQSHAMPLTVPGINADTLIAELGKKIKLSAAEKNLIHLSPMLQALYADKLKNNESISSIVDIVVTNLFQDHAFSSNKNSMLKLLEALSALTDANDTTDIQPTKWLYLSMIADYLSIDNDSINQKIVAGITNNIKAILNSSDKDLLIASVHDYLVTRIPEYKDKNNNDTESLLQKFIALAEESNNQPYIIDPSNALPLLHLYHYFNKNNISLYDALITRVAATINANTISQILKHAHKKTLAELSEQDILSALGNIPDTYIPDVLYKVATRECDQFIENITIKTSAVCMAYNVDLYHLAVASNNVLSDSYTINVWDTRSAALLKNIAQGEGQISSLAYSPDGKQLAAGLYSGSVIIFNSATDTKAFALHEHSNKVSALAYSPNGKQLACASYDGTISLLDLASNISVKKADAYDPMINALVYSSDGTRIISGSGNKTVKIWDAHNMQLLNTLQGHAFGITSVAYSPDSDEIASSSFEGTIRIWNALNGSLINTYETHNVGFMALAYGNNSNQLACSAPTGSITLFNPHTNMIQQKIDIGSAAIRAIIFNKNYSQLAAIAGDDTVSIWSSATTTALVDLLQMIQKQYEK